MIRGIISSPNVIHREPGGFSTGKGLSLEDLRYYALYWDKIVIPTNTLYHFELPQEESFISAGIIERPQFGFKGTIHSEQIPDYINAAQSQIAETLMEDKSTDWVMQQFSSELVLPEIYSTERNALRIDLANCLPVPTGEANIHDILEFKERRQSEFKALHRYLDELYQQALSSPDKSLASKTAIDKLSESITALDTVTQESFGVFTKRNLSSVFNLYGQELGKGLIIDIVTASLTGTALPVATVSNAINATIQVGIQSTQIFKPAEKNQKLAYLSKAREEKLY